jgi:hypothetical protein
MMRGKEIAKIIAGQTISTAWFYNPKNEVVL